MAINFSSVWAHIFNHLYCHYYLIPLLLLLRLFNWLPFFLLLSFLYSNLGSCLRGLLLDCGFELFFESHYFWLPECRESLQITAPISSPSLSHLVGVRWSSYPESFFNVTVPVSGCTWVFPTLGVAIVLPCYSRPEFVHAPHQPIRHQFAAHLLLCSAFRLDLIYVLPNFSV